MKSPEFEKQNELCANCGRFLGENQGFEIVGTQGKWRGAKMLFCDEQCMIEWDCTGVGFKGNQGFNLAEDLDKLRPRKKISTFTS